MLFWIIVKVGIKSLWANKLRSFLAMLGMIIGVGAVIAMLALGAGAKKQILSQIATMGTNLLVISPAQSGSQGVISGNRQNLTVDDARALRNVPGVARVAPVAAGGAQVKARNRNKPTRVTGTTGTYLGIRAFKVAQGRGMSDAECETMARVAVVGPNVATDLFSMEDPVGQRIKVKGINFTVIGVTEAKGDQGWFNPDDQVLIPYTTAMRQLLGQDYLKEVDVQAEEGADLRQVQADVSKLLRARHRLLEGEDDDFYVRNQADFIAMATAFTGTFTLLLGGVAGISLLVGGIGIMNIMLVSVAERTREIGIRKAIGATEGSIRTQFLLETLVISGLGGLLGVVFGILSAWLFPVLFTYVQPDMAFATSVEWPSVLLALGFSAAVGIFFGWYPARRAARLPPVEALRYE